MPASYGLGMAFRFSDSLTIALDVYHTEWDKHKLHKSTGTISPVTGESFGSSDAVTKPTTHVRLGAEYLFIKRHTILAARFGLFYDPDPSQNHPDDFYGASLGLGFSLKYIDVDMAYQFRFANDVATVSLQEETDRNDINQHLLYLSFIFRL
jgi:long-subunit fatty acid transport protein